VASDSGPTLEGLQGNLSLATQAVGGLSSSKAAALVTGGVDNISEGVNTASTVVTTLHPLLEKLKLFNQIMEKVSSVSIYL